MHSVRLKMLKLNRLQFGLMNMRLQGHDRVREIKLWEKIKNELTDKEDFDINDVNKHQAESYATEMGRRNENWSN